MNDIRFEYEEYTNTIHYWKEGMRYQLDVRNLQDCVPIFNTLAEANQELYNEHEELKKDLNNLLETIQRKSSYYDHRRFEKPSNAGNNRMYVKIEEEIASIGQQLQNILRLDLE